LIVEMSGIYGRQILEGISNYQKSHRAWSIFLEERELRAPPPPWLLRKRWDGIICRSTTRQLARAFREKHIAAIDLNDLYGGLGLPRICSDMRAIGRLGAEHLLERGFHNLAFCGFSREAWSTERWAGFAERVSKAGGTCSLYESPWHGGHAPAWQEDQRKIGRWVRSLRKPVGVMATNDVRGQQLLDACRAVDVAVPEEVAVLGVDNDEVLCELCDPPLSSVVPNPQGIGYEAAEMLDGLMARRKASAEEHLIQPLCVASRRSTDVLSIEDHYVAAAVRFIRERACGGVTVDDVVRHTGISRSLLERRFRTYLGRSPQGEIRAVQLKRVKQLLGETDLSLEEIAELAGYAHPEYMSVVFKRVLGLTPGAYRKEVTAEGAKNG